MIPFPSKAECITDLDCLAEAIYFESRGEITAGQVAVAQVIMNRVKSNRFPNTIKEVVHQYKQFSYYWDGKPEVYNEPMAHRKAIIIGSLVLTGQYNLDIVDLSDHYFNDKLVDPRWSKKMIYIGRVGNHVYYKAK